MKIYGAVAIVFGGAQGIGRAYVEALLDKGAKVCLSDMLTEEGNKTTAELQKKYSQESVFFHMCDVSNETQIKDVFLQTNKKYGTINIVINNCGILHEFNWQKCVDVNLGGTIRVVNESRDWMAKDNGGSGGVLVVTSSISGLRPEEFGPVYSATKHAMIAYIRSWALERNYRDHGIRMNCICPTRVATPFGKQVTEDRVLHAEEHLKLEDQARDPLRPEEVATAMVMLIEDDTLNGQALRVTRKYGYDLVKYEEQPIQ